MKSRGFTLVELLVALAILAVLAGLLFPVLSSVRSRARGAQCTSNLRQIGAGILLYAAENNMRLPPFNSASVSETKTSGEWWYRLVAPYVEDGESSGANGGFTDGVWRCPEVSNTQVNASGAFGGGYAVCDGNDDAYTGLIRFNNVGGSARLNQILEPEKRWLIGDGGVLDANGHYIPKIGIRAGPFSNGSSQPAPRHPGRTINVCFADGHMEAISEDMAIKEGQVTSANLGDCLNLYSKDLNHNGRPDW